MVPSTPSREVRTAGGGEILGGGGEILGGGADILGSGADVLSVEEYAEWCGSVGDGFADNVTWGEYAEQLDTFLDETRGIDPPEGLRGYHDVQITSVASLKAFVDTLDPAGVFNLFRTSWRRVASRVADNGGRGSASRGYARNAQ